MKHKQGSRSSRTPYSFIVFSREPIQTGQQCLREIPTFDKQGPDGDRWCQCDMEYKAPCRREFCITEPAYFDADCRSSRSAGPLAMHPSEAQPPASACFGPMRSNARFRIPTSESLTYWGPVACYQSRWRRLTTKSMPWADHAPQPVL